MATIDISRSHDLGKERAREAAEELAEKLKDKLSADYRWEGDNLRFERKGASGRVHVTDDTVRVQVELGLMLRPMKGMIEGKVREYLDTRLG